MMKKNIPRIIKRYLSGRFSPQTEEQVQQWIIKEDDAEEKEQASLEYWNDLTVSPNSKTYSALDKVNERIGYPLQKAKTITVPLYKKLSRIAAILIPLFIITGGYLYHQSAKNGVIEISIAYGEEKHLLLPDRSEIWINSGSTIRYPKEFKGKERIVELDGEAYFSVRTDKSKPFIVNTEKLSVKVLGTKFNIKAYSDEEQVTTTLTSGKIEVSSEKQSHVLKPNEQLSFNKKTSIMNITEIPTKETNAWISGQLIFIDTSLADILKALERRFDISIVNRTSIPATKLYTIKFLKDETINEVLELLSDIADFEYQVNDKQIIIYTNE